MLRDDMFDAPSASACQRDLPWRWTTIPRAAYFKQVQYGVYVRMALIVTLLEVENHVKYQTD
ncbi:MAG: hypothetical protein ACLR8P_12550 [Clostridium fessum]